MTMAFMPDGEIRALYDDDYAAIIGAPPRRASAIEPIQEGPCAGRWAVDMSPAGEAFCYCLWPPFARRDEALAAEHAHLVAHWIESS